jgi:hypothetical protein
MKEIDTEKQTKIYDHIRETMLHKSFVVTACVKMSEYLLRDNRMDIAIALLQRANIHDNSKLVGPELELLSSLFGNQSAFINPNIMLTDSEREIIEKHWENNRHHPEHFNNMTKMNELDILEMVCDWYARSLQYKTDFLEFVKTRQETRFHFPKEMFEKIYKYCEILAQ